MRVHHVYTVRRYTRAFTVACLYSLSPFLDSPLSFRSLFPFSCSIIIMSADLQWQLLRTHTSFLVKRDGATFTSEPNNLAAKHTFKFSGLVNSQAVGISQEDGAVVVTTKRYAHNVHIYLHSRTDISLTCGEVGELVCALVI